ncbi:MAG: TonB-dependent receptor, partial [Bacteroidetes bacterium]|nr:TonB-dependent receptor [Bacteroidota bacterium]
DYVVKMFDIGTTAAPKYGDVQAKIVYDLSPQHKLSLVFLGGDDHNNPDRTVAEENDMLFYGNQDIYQNAGGLVWRALWSSNLYSNTSLGVQSTNAAEDFFETNTGLPMVKNHSTQTAVSLRNSNRIRFSDAHSLEFGIETKQLTEQYDNAFGRFTTAVGDSTPATAVNRTINAAKLGAFITYIVRPFSPLTLTIGTRADHFSYNDRMTISPRASFSLALNDITTFNLSSGMFYQNMPLSLLSQDARNKGLRDPYAVHYIAGVDHLLSEEIKFTAEVYLKEYYDFPVDPSDASLFLVDEMFYRGGLYFGHGQLTNDGKARSLGLELTLQKKLAEDLYGLASVTLFRTEYQGADGVWRRRVFDNQMIVSIEGGYKPNAEWEFSARWIFAGGTPYTPLDLYRSAAEKRAVLDPARINGERYPAYHSLNVRFDKRFHFENSNLVVYLSAWNAYNQKNIAAYFWNEKERKQDTIYQWNLLPIFGVEYEL